MHTGLGEENRQDAKSAKVLATLATLAVRIRVAAY